MKKRKILEIDILRAISALAVITIHVTAYFTNIPVFNALQLSMAYIDNLSGFAVPSFIFISGLVLYKNHNVINGKIIEFYLKRFSKILPIYFLFSLSYFFYTEIIDRIKGREVPFDIIKLMYKLMTGGTFYHLWYFGILFQFYLLYPLFLKLYKKYKIKFVITTFFIQYLWSYLGVNIINSLGKIIVNGNLSLPFAFSHIFWFTLGFYFLENKEKIISIINIKIGIILTLILNIVRTMPFYYGLQQFKYENIPSHYFNITTAINPIFFLIEILVAYKISLVIIEKNNKITNILKKIGNYSLEIYLTHALILILLTKILNKIKISYEELLFYPIIWIGTLCLSYSFALLYRKIESKLKNVK